MGENTHGFNQSKAKQYEIREFYALMSYLDFGLKFRFHPYETGYQNK